MNISIDDITEIQRILAGQSFYHQFTLDFADINRDGYITITDVTEIQRQIAA